MKVKNSAKVHAQHKRIGAAIRIQKVFRGFRARQLYK
jgi:hypothetical protein